MKQLWHNRKGFTLAEVLVAAALIVVLLALGIPFAGQMKDKLEMKTLDEAAKSVYLAAQNRLTAMKASGELADFCDELNDGFSARRLDTAFSPAAPGDYSAGDEQWKELFYLASGDDILQRYVMSETTYAALPGIYLLEINPITGDVYSVFYSESGAYEELLALYTGGESIYAHRSRDERSEYRVGYYTGSDFTYSPEFSYTGEGLFFAPEVKVFNGEELYLRISCNDMLSYASTLDRLTLTVTLTDEAGHRCQKVYAGAANMTELSLNGSQLQVYLLLDSMASGHSFAEITAALGQQLDPGDNIAVTAELKYEYRNENVITDPECTTNAARFNSLFANLTVSGDHATIKIDKLRHLNNLRSSIYAAQKFTSAAVVQTDTIDYDYSTWDSDDWCPETARKINPLSGFRPLVNDYLFGGSQRGVASYDGQLMELRNMQIFGSSGGSGIFDHSCCDLEDIVIVDPFVNGGSNTGALVGITYGGSIRRCGVHLSTAPVAGGRQYDANTMLSRTTRFMINATAGASGVGGLIGTCRNTTVDCCYAAINVGSSGSLADSVGGLIGAAAGSSACRILNSYSSGDVVGRSRCGGLVGSCGAGVANCYSTAFVSAYENAGGFVGSMETGAYVNACRSFGTAKIVSGNPVDNHVGAFAGLYTDSGAQTANNAFKSNVYLRQSGYNETSGTSFPNVTPADFDTLAQSASASTENSHPYSGALYSRAFPFPFVQDNTGLLQSEHWGDWPQEFTIETSVIYYEKYQSWSGDVRYGYYADGYGTDVSGHASASRWNLDTLMSQSQLDGEGYYLVEDGYALLSVYNLTRINYSKNNSATGALTVSATPGDNKFVEIDHPASLPFAGTTGNFTAKFLYIYQLPFALQETNRDSTNAFYDRVKITSAFAKGDNATSVITNVTYFYCPHFAKNAVNPNRSAGTADPAYPGDATTVYVRTARHLNALGRFLYYWNTNNSGRGAKFSFQQELNLNFGQYTTSYCGVAYNIASTAEGNPYRNRPIGRMSNQTGSQFRNIYNGNDYEIIDYCLQTYTGDGFRFTGLFGEIMDAEITNVHMTNTAYSNGSSSNPYVISGYAANSSEGTFAVGALVGLIYSENRDGVFYSSTVRNCSVSGYRVAYAINGALGYRGAVGGLCGISMGTLEYCSAVCKEVSLTAGSDSGGDWVTGVGGLCGSKNAGTLQYCYAGSGANALWLNISSLSNNDSAVGGLCGAEVATWSNVSSNWSLSNCYSYAQADLSRTTARHVYALTSPDRTAGNCYYLQQSDGGSAVAGTPGSGTALSYAQLSGAAGTLGGIFGSATYSRPWTRDLGVYPFPAVVGIHNILTHYGDWPGGGSGPYTVSLTASPEAGGTVSGGGSYEKNASATLTATANPGYHFLRWTENGGAASTDAVYSFTVTGDRSLTAEFEADAGATRTVTVTADPAEGGSVTGGGAVAAGSPVTLTATASAGYLFDHWTQDGVTVGTQSVATYSFTATADTAVTAVFTAAPAVNYTVTVTRGNSHGSVVIQNNGATTASLPAGTTVTVVATPGNNWAFSTWEVNGAVISTQASYSFALTGDVTLTAAFVRRQNNDLAAPVEDAPPAAATPTLSPAAPSGGIPLGEPEETDSAYIPIG